MTEKAFRAQMSSQRMEWETPQEFFDALNARYHFTLDAAASAGNAKCPTYFDEAKNGLEQPWSGTVWCNPPYGRNVGAWCKKAYEESLRGVTSVLLVFARLGG